MTNLTTYPLQDWFETTLAQSWNGATGTVFLNTAPSFTFPSGVKTYIVVNPWKTNMQVGRIDSMNVGNKTVNVDSITIEKWAGLNYTAQIHAVGSKVIISDNYQFWKDIATTINGKADTANPVFTGSVTVPEYADGTARDAAIPTPTDWMIVQTGGVYQGYNSGTAQWEDFDIGTPAPNASTTVKWLVQIATDAEVGASTTTGSTGAELVVNPWSVVKTSSGVGDENKLPALNASWQLDAWFIDNAAILAEWVEALVDKDTYFLWEDADAGDSVFVEDMVTFASATSVQNIGDVTANTRVAIAAFGAAVSANTLKLSLKKFVSPWVDLKLRIETDNAGSPSWSLVDANATATITAASLTTSLVDTTVTLAWSITIAKWTKVWLVLFAGTYGSETVNGTNYFGVGVKLQSTTTRKRKLRGGASWSAVADVTASAAHGVSLSTSAADTASKWVLVVLNQDLQITTVTKDATCNATRCRIFTSAWWLLATATFSTNTATFNIFLPAWTYRVEADASGASYTRRSNGSPSYPYNTTYINFTGQSASQEWSSTWIITNITAIGINTFASEWFAYVSSSLFDSTLLSLTDAKYTYKLPTDAVRIATIANTAWNYVPATILGVNNVQSGLWTRWTKMYISNTPWVLSSTPWFNNYCVGEVINTTKLLVKYLYWLIWTTAYWSILNNMTASWTTTKVSSVLTADKDCIMWFKVSVVSMTGASSSVTMTIEESPDNATRTTMTSDVLPWPASIAKSYFLPVMSGRYYRTQIVTNANVTGGAFSIIQDSVQYL